MDAPIILSITIPTYNRIALLRQTIDLLLPQLTVGVELIVCDNASEDGTAKYLETRDARIKHFRHDCNIGAERNMISCLQQAKGEYVWLLCDDDLPCSNGVSQILGAIGSSETTPGLISLRWIGCDVRMTQFNRSPVTTEWEALDKNAFLQATGEMLTFASVTVVKRNLVDFTFLKNELETGLVPAALALQSAGSSNRILMSKKPLLFARGGNAGGYDAYTVFSRNLFLLLKRGRQLGYSEEALRFVYKSALKGVHLYIVDVWPMTVKGVWNLCVYSLTFKEFYRKVLPALFKKGKGILRTLPHRLVWKAIRRIIRSLTSRFGREIYSLVTETMSHLATAGFGTQVVNIDHGWNIKHPFYLKNPKYFEIGKGFAAMPGLRLEAWDEYQGERFCPRIIIGERVCMNWNVHIGAIERIEIGDDVLIGSHVLITDHSHGSTTNADMLVEPIARPLRSKGPVVIEKNVWIGEGACILSGVTIGNGAIIGANAVVTSNVPAGAVVGGAPAKILNHRVSQCKMEKCK
jgi:acetyltransferase-like isoleucine patch superfamily enzyme/glycosyltransferase involved in cell wall biosynthesis